MIASLATCTLLVGLGLRGLLKLESKEIDLLKSIYSTIRIIWGWIGVMYWTKKLLDKVINRKGNEKKVNSE